MKFFFFIAILLVSVHSQCTTITDCETCADSTICDTCVAGKTPGQTGKTSCVACSLANCATCSTTEYNVCTACSSGYTLSSGSCAASSCSITDCATCNSADSTKCDTCVAGKTPGQTGKTSCVACSLANCATCSTTEYNVCTACSSGYTLSSGSCVNTCPSNTYINANKTECEACASIIPDCAGCSTSEAEVTMCVTCSAGYGLDSAKACVQCASNCKNCTNSTSCAECNSGYSLSLDLKTCTSTISNCKTLAVSTTGDVTCSACNAGYGIKSSDSTKCLTCIISNCETCVLDANNNPTCSVCSSGYAVKDGICADCTKLSPNCANCTYSATTKKTTCTACANTYSFLQDGSCVDCGTTTGSNTPLGIANCDVCSLSGTTLTCSACENGYYLDETCKPCSTNCSTCSGPSVCSACKTANYLTSEKTCTSCIENCDICTDGTTCSDCSFGFYYATPKCTACTASKCDDCSNATNCTDCSPTFFLENGKCDTSCSTDCDTCVNSSTCTTCKSSFFIVVKNSTCVANCTDLTQVKFETNSSCVDCGLIFPECTTCNTTQCKTCPNTTFLAADGSGCGTCNGTYDSLNTTTSVCNKQSKTTLETITVNGTTKLPLVTIDCAVNSSVYYAYGLSNSATSFSLETIQATTGKNLQADMSKSANESSQYWIGYGAKANFGIKSSFSITGALKNSGESYRLIAYCVSFVGGLNSNSTGNWTQTDNGARQAVLKFSATTAFTAATKQTLGSAIKTALKIQRTMYTDEGVLVGTTARLLQTSNTTNTTASTTTYTTSFYIVPDYTLTSDPLNTIVNNSIADSTTFLTSVTAALGTASSSITLTAITQEASLEVQQTPIFNSTSPTFTVTSTSISFNLALSNTAGYIYVGIGKTLATKSSRLLEDTNTSNTTTNTSNTTTTTTTVTVNLTVPSWTQLMNSTDVDNMAFVSSKNSSVTLGTNFLINFTSLTAGTNYTIYFGASNYMFPKLYSSIYAANATTSTTDGGSGDGSTYGVKSMGSMLVMVIALIAALLG